MIGRLAIASSIFIVGFNIISSLPKKNVIIGGTTVDLTQEPTVKEKRFEVINREQLDDKVICITFKDKFTNQEWMMIYTSHLYKMGGFDEEE